MERKILTFENSLGETEDLLPVVDDLSVMIDGTNLRDYLNQIEETLQRANLFLGAYESENVLLEKYPDGTELEQGTYAIVTDTDTLYIYDVDTLRWLKTVGSINGILQLNGLTPVNGSLTITGGDIYATVGEADTPNEKITTHLNTLYKKTKQFKYALYGTILLDTNNSNASIGSHEIVYNCHSSSLADFVLMRFRGIFDSQYDNRYVRVNFTSDSTSFVRNYNLYSSNGNLVTYGDLRKLFGNKNNSYGLIYMNESNQEHVFLGLYTNPDEEKEYTLNQDFTSSNWIDNEEATGYKQVFDYSNYNEVDVLSVYKLVEGAKTTAIYDYKLKNKILTLYSEEAFDGGLIIRYTK